MFTIYITRAPRGGDVEIVDNINNEVERFYYKTDATEVCTEVVNHTICSTGTIARGRKWNYPTTLRVTSSTNELVSIKPSKALPSAYSTHSAYTMPCAIFVYGHTVTNSIIG